MKYYVITFIVLILALMAWPALTSTKVRAAIKKGTPECTHLLHQRNQWSPPDLSSDWYNGTRYYQSRTCKLCGVAEMKTVQVSPNAK